MDVCRVTRGAHINISSYQKIFLSSPVAVNNSIKVGPLVFLLYMFVITENIMKSPVYVLWNITVYSLVEKTSRSLVYPALPGGGMILGSSKMSVKFYP
jgi:hypothetical protein